MLDEILEIKGILFDLDDTLIDSAKAQHNAICSFRRLYSIFENVEDSFFSKLWEEIAKEEYEMFLNDKITFEKMRIRRVQRIFSSFSYDISDEEAIKIFENYIDLYKRNWQVFEDTYRVLEYLREKYKIAIVSNGDGLQQKEKIIHTGLDKYFTNVVISGEVGYAKPDKKIFDEACKELGLKPENCIMIGDKYKVDIEGALNAGINAIWVNRKNEESDYKHQIKELADLLKIL